MRLLLILLLAGCATTQELVESGDKSEHTLNREPALAIACMSRNFEIERSNPNTNMLIRPLDNGGSELVVPTMLVAHARPEGAGSHVTVWMRPLWFVGKAELIPAMIKGC